MTVHRYGRYAVSIQWMDVFCLILAYSMSAYISYGQNYASVPKGVFSNPMYGMMAVYMKQHSVYALIRESSERICKRTFVIGKMNCNGMGNGNNQFLDNLFWAVVFNRTFVAYLYGQRTCNDYISARRWIANETALINLLQENGCPMEKAQKNQLFGEGNTQIGLAQMSRIEEGIKYIRCCAQLEEEMGKMRFISPGMWPMGSGWRLTYETFHSNPNAVSVFSEQARNRFQKLTNMDQYPTDPARGFATSGHLSLMSVRYSDSVKELTKDTLAYLYDLPADTFLNNARDDSDDLYQFTDLRLRWPADRVVFGIHGRHQFNDLHREYLMDNQTAHCLFHEINHTLYSANYLHGHERCTVLITSDRAHTIHSMMQVATHAGCDVRFVDRMFVTEQRNEHGPWSHPASELSKADTYLVSHSNYFIGVKTSTFSMFIAQYVAARSEIAHYLSRTHGPSAAEANGGSECYSSSNSSNATSMQQQEFHTPHFIWSIAESTGKCSSFLDRTIASQCDSEVSFIDGSCGPTKRSH